MPKSVTAETRSVQSFCPQWTACVRCVTRQGMTAASRVPSSYSSVLLPAEGAACLIIAPDSNVLMTRPANLVRFNELLNRVGPQLVEGQDSLTFTAKVLFPFTVTQELDRMKDPHSGVHTPCRPSVS